MARFGGQDSETRRSIRQVELALQEFPEGLQLADGYRGLVTLSRYLAWDEIKQDFPQMIRRHLWRSDAEIPYTVVQHRVGPITAADALVHERLSFRLLPQQVYQFL